MSDPNDIGQEVTIAEPGELQAQASPIGLQLADNLTYQQWADLGRQVLGAAESSMWWAGDWLLYADQHFAVDPDTGEERSDQQARIRQTVAAITNLDLSTLRDARKVAERFPVAKRRSTVSFAHHARVVDCQGQLAEQLLDHAADEGWTSDQLASERRKWEATETAATDDESGAEADPWQKPVHASIKVTLLPAQKSTVGPIVAEAAQWLRDRLRQEGIDDVDVKVP